MKTDLELSNIDWPNHIVNYRKSGLTKSAYCSVHELPLESFQYHYRRWNKESKLSRTSDNSPPVSEFSPVILTEKPKTESVKPRSLRSTASGVELQLANGIRCKVEANFCQETLKQVMEVLK